MSLIKSRTTFTNEYSMLSGCIILLHLDHNRLTSLYNIGFNKNTKEGFFSLKFR